MKKVPEEIIQIYGKQREGFSEEARKQFVVTPRESDKLDECLRDTPRKTIERGTSDREAKGYLSTLPKEKEK